ncbi:unnamed protein product, partial [Prorocentrum cordatum]
VLSGTVAQLTANANTVTATMWRGSLPVQATARELVDRAIQRGPAASPNLAQFARWSMRGTLRSTATRFELNLQRLWHLLPTRIAAAVCSADSDRWHAARRFQNTMDIHVSVG